MSESGCAPGCRFVGLPHAECSPRETIGATRATYDARTDPVPMLEPTPAAMLGEATGLLRRAEALLLSASSALPRLHVAELARGAAVNTRTWAEDAQREAEAREGLCEDASCPKCKSGEPCH